MNKRRIQKIAVFTILILSVIYAESIYSQPNPPGGGGGSGGGGGGGGGAPIGEGLWYLLMIGMAYGIYKIYKIHKIHKIIEN